MANRQDIEIKKRQITILAAGHMATDLNQGALPALLPFFISAWDLSYAAAAAIVFAVNISSSIIQPMFGLAADRFAKPWLLPLGMMLACLGLGLSGLCSSYPLLLILGIISGVGIAAYHPQAARLVNLAAGDRKNTAMSFFGVGGTIGFAVGPLIASTAVVHWGLSGTLVLLIPATIMSIVVMSQFPLFEELEAAGARLKNAASSVVLKENWSAFARIGAMVSLRSIVFFGLNIFIPIYWIKVFGQSHIAGAVALSIFSGSGIVGNIIGGTLADHYGQRRVVVTGFLGLSILLPLFIAMNSLVAATILLIPLGAVVFVTYSPTIILGQRYLPGRVGLSSGVTIGLAVAIGGGAAPLIGKLADIYGVWMAFASLTPLPVLIFLIALTLPAPAPEEARPAETENI